MIEKINIFGYITTITIYVLAILVFISRLARKPKVGYWIGYFELLMAIPLVYLLIMAFKFKRPALYYIQIILMLLWLIVMALLDYIFKIDFRQVKWMVIGFVMLFFAGTGGMIGIASYAGRQYSIKACILFFIMAVLSFVQRYITGL